MWARQCQAAKRPPGATACQCQAWAVEVGRDHQVSTPALQVTQELGLRRLELSQDPFKIQLVFHAFFLQTAEFVCFLFLILETVFVLYLLSLRQSKH